MSQIFVVKRRAGIESVIPVWNLGGFIELPIAYSDDLDPKVVDAVDAALSLGQI